MLLYWMALQIVIRFASGLFIFLQDHQMYSDIFCCLLRFTGITGLIGAVMLLGSFLQYMLEGGGSTLLCLSFYLWEVYPFVQSWFRETVS